MIRSKKWQKKYWTKEVVIKQEFEFKLKGKEQVDNLLELFKDLGFEEWVKKTKWNETYSYNKDRNLNIEINRVKHLGYFMEIEYLTTKSNIPTARNKIIKILKKLKVDLVFIPKTKDIYNSKRLKKISLSQKDKILCAKYRKGHFEGVIDVMDRLTKLIKPNKIFMGEKDYQQFFLLKKFIEKRYPSKIINCKTIRDNKSIALSSRNILLKSKSLKIRYCYFF